MNVKAYLSRMLINGGVLVRFPGGFTCGDRRGGAQERYGLQRYSNPVFETARSLPEPGRQGCVISIQNGVNCNT